MSNLRGYLTLQLAQSCRQSSPSIVGSVVGNSCSVCAALVKSPAFVGVGTTNDDDDDSAEVSLYDRFRNMAGTRYALNGPVGRFCSRHRCATFAIRCAD